VSEDDVPFARSTIEPNALERLVAQLIWARRRSNPITIAEICRGDNRAAREVKAAVESLVTVHRCRIGARRGEPAGYFWIQTAEDQAAAVGPYRAQILAMLRRLRVLDSAEDYRRFVGQLALEGGE
jgi:hypothetical protein